MATPAGCAPIITALGDDVDALVDLVGGWSQQVLAAGGFPAPRRP
ncbi:MAG TPA: hypothetical protein VL179_06935 [Mycobacterium sp.]|nr:hypothetical protein [Mycobacterium sp.]